jgi:hypothetical protein
MNFKHKNKVIYAPFVQNLMEDDWGIGIVGYQHQEINMFMFLINSFHF